MNSITQKANIRYMPHSVTTKVYAVEMLRNGSSVYHVCRKYHVSRTSLWRWHKKYNGTKESLFNGSHRPLTSHPNAHNEFEISWIKSYIKRNPHATLCELWYKLKRNKGYSRHPVSLYRFLKKLGYYGNYSLVEHSKYVPKPYDTPKELGQKWQIDVKYVPKECKCDCLPHDMKYYQYTCIDEASRERYIYHYVEQCAQNTIDFTERCIKYFGYTPKCIQTDNGMEFTYFKEVKKLHPFDEYCSLLNIHHKLIRPRTPRHNGKVERSHRNDNERFYKYLKFYSFEDLVKQAAQYLRRSNNIPMATLNYLTPKEMRKKLLSA